MDNFTAVKSRVIAGYSCKSCGSPIIEIQDEIWEEQPGGRVLLYCSNVLCDNHTDNETILTDHQRLPYWVKDDTPPEKK